MFKTARIRFVELYNDALNFMKGSYESVGQYFTMASPTGQLLQVILNMGRMILYYIEDSITELNIRIATRPNNIRGLASLTGHNPSRGQAARGTIRLNYNGNKLDIYGNTIIIPNFSRVKSTLNGLTYTMILPSEEIRLDLTSINNYLDVNVVQGIIEYQQATGSGDALQSYNFQARKGTYIDNYFINVYVDGKKWRTSESILDMTYKDEAVMIKTGQTGGLDIFFGNEYNGKIPPLGSTILIEYLTTDGEAGNLNTQISQKNENWKFVTKGFSLAGEEVSLDKIIKVSIQKDILFGSPEEPLYLTRLLAPHVSRSFVLANADSYIYFLRRLNLFTIIDAIPGFATFEDKYAIDKYNIAKTNYENVSEEYRKLISTVGAESEKSIQKKEELDRTQGQLYYWQEQLDLQKQDDNTVYLFLIPDVNKRIPSNQNYYTCSINSFILSQSEKTAILDLIEESGQRVMTVDNAIMNLKYPRFVLNTSLIIYEGYDINNIRESIISKTSEYFLKNTRRDRLPASDIVRIIENIDGVDSVSVWFDASKENINIYGDHYGIDDYGDIVLARYVMDAFGNKILVKDVYPIIRGGWESSNGIYYEDSIAKDKLSTVNIQLRGITQIDLNTKTNQAIMGTI